MGDMNINGWEKISGTRMVNGEVQIQASSRYEIRIYIETLCGVEGLGDKQGIGTYYMTYFKDGEWREPPETQEWMDRQNKRRKCLYVTRPCMEVLLLTDALRELKGKSRIEIFCNTKQLVGFIRNYIPLWKQRGWMDSRGKTVRQEYIDLDAELSKHELKDITDGEHEYSIGLKTELVGVIRRGASTYGTMVNIV